MATQFFITIVTNEDTAKAEQDLRKAIASAGYNVDDLVVDLIDESLLDDDNDFKTTEEFLDD